MERTYTVRLTKDELMVVAAYAGIITPSLAAAMAKVSFPHDFKTEQIASVAGITAYHKLAELARDAELIESPETLDDISDYARQVDERIFPK